MHHRHTLAGPIDIEGVGLHSGREVRMRLMPARPGSGVVFVRTDRGGVEVPATLDHAGPSFYATVIGKEDVLVRTIEHLMAALYALLVDDVRIEIDGDEVPILDGSSKPFVDAVLRVGRRPLARPREYINLVRPVVVSEEEKRIAAYPCGEYRVTYAIEFDHPRLGYQELSAGLWSEDAFATKLAPARTFTLERDVAVLRSRGLALGGSLDNAVVIGEDGILNPALRFDDEFVRHKMLDLSGDLSLLGHPLRAHVVAYRAGHDLHARLARRIWEARDSWYLAPWIDGRADSEATVEA